MEWDHIIHKYINHSLTSEEKKLFDRLYLEDESFRAEVEMINDLKQVVESNDRDNLKMIMAEAEEKLSISNTRRYVLLRKKWWIIIVALFIASIIGYYLMHSRSSSTQLYASYYKTPFNTYYPVTRDNSNVSPISKAFLAYEQKDFKKAEELLSNLSPNDEINFYRAISLGELGAFANAVEILNMIQTEDDLLQEDIWWYKGLYQLALSDKAGAITSFQNIKATTNPSRKPLVDQLLQ